MHYRNISQRLVLLRRTEEAAKYLEQTKLQTSNGFTEEFTVMEDLMGLAIGAHGANIQQARKIDGIINVELIEDSCTFKVWPSVKFSSTLPMICKICRWLVRPRRRWQKRA